MSLTRICALLAVVLVGVPLSAADLVVYSGRGESLVGPLFAQFEEETGLDVDVRYGGTPALATQLAEEGGQSPADVFYAQESGYIGALADAGLFAQIDSALLDQVDPRFRDSDGQWIGVSGRLRVLVYNPEMIATEDMPQSLRDLADDRYAGKLGWAPGNGSFIAHVSALRHIWGEDATRSWLQGVADNDPGVYPKNSPQVKAADAGEIAIGWVNHYYLHRFNHDGFSAENYSFPNDQDAGNVLMVSGLAVLDHSQRKANAARLIAFLVSEQAQNMLAQEGFEYPVRPGVETHEDVQPLSEISLAEVDQAALTDVLPTLELLRELGLQ